MRVATIVGARPQFIKAAPVSRAIEAHNRGLNDQRLMIQEILIHTGQHYDDNMSDVFFRDLELPKPDYYLGVGSGSQAEQTGEMLKGVEQVLSKENPDMVVVYGDTNSTLAGALAAAKLHIPVAHVEAGLRSYNRKMPEEINRVVTDHVSDLLFCPTETAVKNLAQEGITQGVHLVGDVMYDSVLYNVQLAEKRSKLLERLRLKPKGYALATIHRAENTEDRQRLGSIFQAIDAIARKGLPVIVPLHPRTRKNLGALKQELGHVRLIEPVSYLNMLLLERQARVILTDSGGVQKEAYWFQVPCVTLREETEWVETVESGWNVLVGADKEKIKGAVLNESLINNGASQLVCGRGDAAKRIATMLITGVSA